MKLHCNVEVSNRSLPVTNFTKKKAQRSCLAIGRQTVNNDKIYLLLQTQTNKQGTKYNVDGNIEKIFTKFVTEGKATIRLTVPPHDLIVQCESVQLKSFIHVLKLVLSKKGDPAVLALSNLNPKKFSTAPKTKILIKKNSDYPTLEGFPKTTKELHVVGLNRKSFDRQILRLQSLTILNLSDNLISSLPKELGSLPYLKELYLAHNQLGKTVKWTWLDQSPIINNLRLLDISNNLLSFLPNQIGKLKNLTDLKVNQNLLKYLPHSIGNLSNLQYLNISKNSISQLPGNIRNLRLQLFDLSENSFSSFHPISEYKLQLCSLLEFAAKAVLKAGLWYNDDTIPPILVRYLDTAGYCVCKTAIFENYIRKSVLLDLCTISTGYKTSGPTTVTLDCFFCSMLCVRRKT
ncbi:leucine-rich repeat protein 1-like [Prorops nasuta]|uniref:leucine-rich repeat protein 1-like n=1 Tax=Prorops nasuta TaxID=863751 RepID=UPI0034CDC69E